MRSILLPAPTGETPVLVGDGGTGFTSFTAGDMLVAHDVEEFSKIAAVAEGQVLISQGIEGEPIWSPAVSLTTSLTTPKLLGGTGTTSTLTLQPTSGVGTTNADIIFKNGNNGATEVARFVHAGHMGVGVAAPGTYIGVTKGLIVGSVTDDEQGQVGTIGNISGYNASVGDISWANIASTEQASKRVALIRAIRTENDNTHDLSIFTSVVSVGLQETMHLTGAGALSILGTVTPISATEVTAGGVAAITLGASAPKLCVGSGAPTLSAPQGSVYVRSDGSSTSTRLYINTNGSTTWTSVVTAA